MSQIKNQIKTARAISRLLVSDFSVYINIRRDPTKKDLITEIADTQNRYVFVLSNENFFIKSSTGNLIINFLNVDEYKKGELYDNLKTMFGQNTNNALENLKKFWSK